MSLFLTIVGLIVAFPVLFYLVGWLAKIGFYLIGCWFSLVFDFLDQSLRIRKVDEKFEGKYRR